MHERLVFSYGTSGHHGDTPGRHDARVAPRVAVTTPSAAAAPVRARTDRRDWAFTGLMAFTALLFFRPQDHIPALNALHLAELSALVALAAMIAGRLGRGLAPTRITPELAGIGAFAAIILMTAPFSVWPGGSVATFTDLYLKVLLIFVLMLNTLRTPKRVEQFTWLIVAATGYIAFRATFDYARGINLIENGRVQGAIGGMFRNPNDLALNMVAVLPLAAAFALWGKSLFRRLAAAACGLLMAAAIVASHSRSGAVGLAAMVLFLGAVFVRRRPGLVLAGVLAAALALPFAPDSYWNRISSITDGSQDDTGSREARKTLLRESLAAFLAHPLTGVGAGQFKNYKPEGRQEAWRESHNVLLQVAAELGLFGVAVFAFLIVRGALASRQARRLLRRAGGTPPRRGPPAAGSDTPAVARDEAEFLQIHAAAMGASLAGWFVCALFASVAYNWTFYYLLALAIAPREILADRLTTRRSSRRNPAVLAPVTQGARA
jgi:O-antigen ligase